MPEIRSGRTGPDHQPARRKKSPAKLILGIAAVILVAIAAGWALTHMNSDKAGQSGPGGAGGPGGPGAAGGGRRGGGGGRGRAAITVGTAPASIGAIPIQLDALGTVTPPITATITPRVSGNLMAVYFTEGQVVKKGQKLALIDPRPFQVALEQAQGTLARDEAALANARLDLQRYTTLVAQNSIARQQLDTQDALVKQDEGVVKTDKAAVDNAKLNLQYANITAPVSGKVGLRLVDVGNYITAGSTTGIVVITQVDPIDVVFTIPEDNVGQITKRQHSGATLPVTVFNRGGSEALAMGNLSTLDNQIDTTTGTVKAKARFDNGAGALYPNQFVNARMVVDVLCNVVVVPGTAVRHGSQGDYVFALQPDKTVKMVMVTTGPGTGEQVSIAKGLTGNETVITEGGDRLRDGSAVQLPGDRPQGGSGFSGGKRGRRGGQAGGQGGGQFAGAQGGQGQTGQSGQGGRRGGRRGQGAQGGQGAAMQPTDLQTQATTAQGIPTAQIPPGACSNGKGGQGRGGNGQGHGSQGGQGLPAGQGDGRFHRGQDGQPQGEPGQGPRGQGGAQGQGQAAGQGQGGFRRHRQDGQNQGGQPQGQGG